MIKANPFRTYYEIWQTISPKNSGKNYKLLRIINWHKSHAALNIEKFGQEKTVAIPIIKHDSFDMNVTVDETKKFFNEIKNLSSDFLIYHLIIENILKEEEYVSNSIILNAIPSIKYENKAIENKANEIQKEIINKYIKTQPILPLTYWITELIKRTEAV